MQNGQPSGRHVLLFALLLAPVAAFAQFKCVQPDGKVAFQQMPCEGGATSEKLGVRSGAALPPPAGAEPRNGHWAAIARGVPEVGMTRGELDSALGRPDKVATGQNGADSDELLTYHKPDKKYDVSLRNGVVTSVYAQDPDKAQAAAAQAPVRKRTCLTPAQIRDLEFEASKIANRNNYALRAQIADQKACR
jgi:hypothetical protein